MKVVITGGAGRIAYSLIPLVCDGTVFGPGTKISLRLLDMEVCAPKLDGIKMEIEDSCYSLIEEVIVSFDQAVAMADADVAILLGGFPRLPGMERKDLIAKNAEGMISQAKCLELYAKKSCKVLVVANPANTNCLVGIKSATSVPPQNFSCLTRLDQERLRGMVAQKICDKAAALGETLYPCGADIEDVFIFGNHSTTQAIYTASAKIRVGSECIPAASYIDEADFSEILSRVQNRGAEVMGAQKASSALSAANAIAKHLKDWLGPEHSSTFSIGILSNGNPYGVPDDLVYSFPCKRIPGGGPGEIYILDGLTVGPSLLVASTEELLSEKRDAEEFLKASSL